MPYQDKAMSTVASTFLRRPCLGDLLQSPSSEDFPDNADVLTLRLAFCTPPFVRLSALSAFFC